MDMIERVVGAMETAGEAYLATKPLDAWEDIPMAVFARAAIEAMRRPLMEFVYSNEGSLGDLTEKVAKRKPEYIWSYAQGQALCEIVGWIGDWPEGFDKINVAEFIVRPVDTLTPPTGTTPREG